MLFRRAEQNLGNYKLNIMCGRYTQLFSWEELHRLMSIVVPGEVLVPRYNVAPTQVAPVVRQDRAGTFYGSSIRWGLIPSWTKEQKSSLALINARAETISAKPSFRNAFKRQRCVVPASGYFEWHQVDKVKQPIYLTRNDEKPILFAGIWDCWQDPTDTIIESFSIVTTNVNASLAWIHDRMPVILDQSQYKDWIRCSEKEAQQMMLPLADDILKTTKVSTYVNSVRNIGEKCIEPI